MPKYEHKVKVQNRTKTMRSMATQAGTVPVNNTQSIRQIIEKNK